MYRCPACDSTTIQCAYPALVVREQDGIYLYRVDGSVIEESRDPVRAECVDCAEMTSSPDSWWSE